MGHAGRAPGRCGASGGSVHVQKVGMVSTFMSFEIYFFAVSQIATLTGYYLEFVKF